ncbi:MAG: phenylalanine--tRNA ligase subunit beta [Acidimicrobiaceae bacterium]|nr:phenylalanine--tRNA ligase subunit beta [Acidimicrobiaceae bacterium]
MKILGSWLNDFGSFGSDNEKLAAAMTSLGLAVESITSVGSPIKGVVVARVLRTERHPDAAKVHRVYVDAGDSLELHVWCGAFNIKSGDLVPLATLGTQMPDGRIITARGILGIESHGMLCSSIELGLGADSEGILVLPSTLKLGTDVFKALGISSDVVFDLDVTRNRPDCNGYLGVARDLGAHLGVKVAAPSGDKAKKGPARTLKVEIIDKQRCARFNVTVISGLRVTDSPDWIARRLTNCGMRPINNVVDASNIVMLELNQPAHPYDGDKVTNGFRIRCARDGETIRTLDDQVRQLETSDLLICDGDDTAIGIAGVMGGAKTEISEATTCVALETAWFEASGIARTAARLGLRSEASLRFERGVDPYGIDHAVSRFAAVLRESCPQLVVHAGAADPKEKSLPPKYSLVSLRVAQVNRLLGTKLTAKTITALLAKIGFATKTVTTTSEPVLKIAVPSWRPDCQSEIDLVEEIARHVGYENLGKILPQSTMHGRLSPTQQRRRDLREIVLGLGLNEAMPNPFLAPGDLERSGLDGELAIRLANPLVAEESILRTSLRPGLLKAIAYNLSHRVTDISLFEIGHVYPSGSGELPDEYESLCIVASGESSALAMDWWSQVSSTMNFGAQLDQRNVESGYHPTRSASLRRGKQLLGSCGEIDPLVLAKHGITVPVACLELNLSILLSESPKIATAKPVSRFPSSDFDLAFALNKSEPASSLLKVLRQAAGNELVEISLFDVYRGAGVADTARSLTFRLCLQATDRTLTDAEVTATRQRCIDAANKLGAQLRN